MSARPLGLPAALPRLVRAERGRVVGGVCAGLAQTLAVDATLVRLTFALLAFARGAGIVVYLGAWALLPVDGSERPSPRRRLTGALLLIVSVQLLAEGLGLTGTLVWPLALVGGGLVLATGAAALGLEQRHGRALGIVLVVVGAIVFVDQNTGGAARVVLAPGAVTIALLLVVGPWAWRLARERDTERAARIRTEERADLAARVHDSVLQTLALIQREPHDARRVATLARRQERELRAWLYPDREPAPGGTLADAVEAAVGEIEELHGVRVELARSGNGPLDERTRVLVLAAREAMANAAKHAGTDEIAVFVEAGDGGVAIYVRDRGVGFDPAAVPGDRRGVSESILARMERVGGVARVVSAPGEGTEVELELPAEETP